MNWIFGLQAVEAIGIIASLIFAAVSFRRDALVRGFDNDIKVVAAHREIWIQLFEKPELARLLAEDRDMQREPLSLLEERFVCLVCLHLAAVLRGRKLEVLPRYEGIETDVATFFRLPAVKAAWERLAPLQDTVVREMIGRKNDSPKGAVEKDRPQACP